jgi:hypothetical protein
VGISDIFQEVVQSSPRLGRRDRRHWVSSTGTL